MSQRLILNQLSSDNTNFLANLALRAKIGLLSDNESKSVEKIFGYLRDLDKDSLELQKELEDQLYDTNDEIQKTVIRKFLTTRFAELEVELRRTTDKVRNAVIHSGAITKHLPTFTPQTIQRLMIRAAAASDFIALDILWMNLDLNGNGRCIASAFAEAFRDAAARDDVDVMKWLWDLFSAPNNLRLISGYDYFAVGEACDSKATNAVRWMWEKTSVNPDVRKNMDKLLTPELRSLLNGNADSEHSIIHSVPETPRLSH